MPKKRELTELETRIDAAMWVHIDDEFNSVRTKEEFLAGCRSDLNRLNGIWPLAYGDGQWRIGAEVAEELVRRICINAMPLQEYRRAREALECFFKDFDPATRSDADLLVRLQVAIFAETRSGDALHALEELVQNGPGRPSEIAFSVLLELTAVLENLVFDEEPVMEEFHSLLWVSARAKRKVQWLRRRVKPVLSWKEAGKICEEILFRRPEKECGTACGSKTLCTHILVTFNGSTTLDEALSAGKLNSDSTLEERALAERETQVFHALRALQFPDGKSAIFNPGERHRIEVEKTFPEAERIWALASNEGRWQVGRRLAKSVASDRWLRCVVLNQYGMAREVLQQFLDHFQLANSAEQADLIVRLLFSALLETRSGAPAAALKRLLAELPDEAHTVAGCIRHNLIWFADDNVASSDERIPREFRSLLRALVADGGGGTELDYAASQVRTWRQAFQFAGPLCNLVDKPG